MGRNKIPFCLHPLDPRLVLAKPLHKIDPAEAKILEDKGCLAMTRKRDGHRHIVVVTGNGSSDVRIYTRTMNEATEKFPHLVRLISSVGIPSGTILDTELVCEKEPGVDDFEQVSRIARNASSVLLQQKEGYARLVVLAPVAHDNVMMVKEPFSKRYGEVVELFRRYEGLHEYARPIELVRLPFEAARVLVSHERWEGLVLYDVTKGTSYRLDGAHDNPPRPVGCWKWKPYFEEDFVATHFVYGKGRNARRMGKMYISQRDPQTGKLFPCGEVGVGFSDEEREQYANKDVYPFVIEVKYEKRFKSNSLRFPVFLRERCDKTVDECYPTN